MDKILEEFEEFYKSQPFYDLKTDYEMANALGIYHLELKDFLKQALTQQKQELLKKLDEAEMEEDYTLKRKDLTFNAGIDVAKNIINNL